MADHTFIFNHNDRGDIMFIRPNGETDVLRTISDAEDGKNEKGEEFQFVEAQDEAGNISSIVLFSNPKIGLILKLENLKIQFAYF
ncbi:hypothetical protein [Cognataquiflexum rubidum]|uniref:hypothetical protein n=1 Tax=Cognataquiflexum rubidum TaxID=2922273 RepID=UPI001F1319FA|nr:hypothetical protein [Cognataquiflexum rubidum]MCH6236670.1 hypothetical protein [Cognataquiflexum rubidum]